MLFKIPHTWTTDIQEEKSIQNKLKNKLITKDNFGEIKLIAGIDVGFEEDGHLTRAAVALLTWPNLEIVDRIVSRGPTVFPYIPGFLSFREIPQIITALSHLKTLPNLLICDGHGIAHPRQMGIASHLGVITGLPSIGAAKSILVGSHKDVAQEKGAWQPLIYKNQTIGVALRTRKNVKPMYISLGHRISLETAVDFIMKGTTKYRLPEATRWAHKLASLLKNDPSLLK